MEPHDLLTRAELAKSLGVSKSKIRRMETRGELKPVINERGVRLFPYGAVADLIGDRDVVRLDHARAHVPSAAKASGELSAAVFELAEQGVHPVDIVRRLKIHHDVVDGILAKWGKWRRAVIFRTANINALADALEIQPSRDVETLLSRIARKVHLLKKDATCVRCKHRRASYCGPCVDERT